MNHLVRVQAAFHQHLDIAAGGQICRFLGGRVAVRDRNNFNTREVNASLLRQMANAHLRANQHRDNQAVACRIHGAGERLHVARVHHGAAHGLQAFAHGQQVLEPGFGVKQLNQRRADTRQAHLDRGRNHLGGAVQHAVALLVDHLAIQLNALLDVVFGQHGRRHREGVTNAHGLGEVQHLLQVNGAGAGKLCAEQRRNQGSAPHAVGDDTVKQGVIGVLGIQVRGVGVAGHRGKSLDVGQRQSAQQARALAK